MEFLISVLYVDDEEIFLEMAKRYIERTGNISVDAATSAFQAMKKLEEQSYDAIVSDYQMPGMDGISLLKHVRQSDNQIPFILFTGHGREEVAIEALNNGADYYIQKGNHWKSEFVQLEHEIRESVRRRRAENEQRRIGSILRIKDAAVRSALSPIAISDLEGNLLYANPVCLTTWGFTHEDEILGRPVTDFVAFPEDAIHIIEMLRQDKSWSGEGVMKKRDGTTFDALVNASMIEGEDGQPVGFVSSFADLTEQKQAQARIESYLMNLKYISKKATEMSDYPVDGNFYDFIADSLEPLVPEDILIFVNSVNNDTGTVRVEAARRIDCYLPIIEELIGHPLLEMTLTASGDALEEMLQGSFIEIHGGVKELVFGHLPKSACSQLEELPIVDKIIGSGLSWNGRVNGTVILILPPDTSLEHMDILDLFIRHASAVLHRRWVESALMRREGN